MISVKQFALCGWSRGGSMIKSSNRGADYAKSRELSGSKQNE